MFLVDAQNGTYTSLEDYKRKRGEKVGKLPSKADVEEASRNGLRWMKITEADRAQRRYDGENRKYENIGINGSEGVSTFAMRPGWHAGSLPTMRQIGKGAEKNLRDDKFVWVEGEISADVDYNEEAQGNPDKDIPTHIPTDGFYMKATNANKKASQADRVGWYVAGAFKPNRIMSDSETRQVIDAWNAEHQDAPVEYDWPRESGREFNADTMSLEEGFNTYFRVDGTEEDRITYAEREATGVTLGRMGDGLGVKIRRIGSASMPAGHKTDKGYYDLSKGNEGGKFRKNDVDLYQPNMGIVVGHCQKGEWLKYTVSVAADGEYEISALVAGENGTGSFKLYMDSVEIGTEIANEGKGFETFTTVSGGKATLKAGEHELKLEITNDWIDIDYVEFKAVSSGTDNLVTLRMENPVKESSFAIVDMQGRKLGVIQATNMAEAVEKTKKNVTQNMVSGGVYFVVSNTKSKHRTMQKVVIYEK